jgi:hypothetical protein
MRFNGASGIVRLVTGLVVLGVGIACGVTVLRDGTAPTPPAPWANSAPQFVADGGAPTPPPPWSVLTADGGAPTPPAPWGAPIPA